MWTEIGAGFGGLTIVGVIAKTMHSRISGKVGKDLCDQRYKEIISRLERGDRRFDKIDKKLDDAREMAASHGETLVSIETKLDLINGRG